MCLFISCYCLSYHSLLVCFAWWHIVWNLFHGWCASCNIPNSSFACRPCFFFLILSIRPLASRIHIQPSWGGYPCPHHIHIQPPWGGYPCPHHALPIMFGLNCTLCMAAIPGRDELHVSGLLCPAPSAPPCLPCAVRNYICTLLGLWTLSILENDE